MAAGTYKIGVPIVVTYQASKADTGKTIQMDVYDDAQSLTLQSGIMIEIGSTGRYCKSFTPDVEGEWIVMMSDSGKGEVAKAFAICGQDLDTVGDNVDAIKTKIDTIPADPASTTNVTAVENKVDIVDGVVDAIKTKTDTIPADPAETSDIASAHTATDALIATVGNIVDTMEIDIRGTDGDTLKDLSDEIDAISSPAMVG